MLAYLPLTLNEVERVKTGALVLDSVAFKPGIVL